MKRNDDGTWTPETLEQAACFGKDFLLQWVEVSGFWTVTSEEYLEAIKPREGRQVRMISSPGQYPYVVSYVDYMVWKDCEWANGVLFVDDNALTRGTCGEIRERIRLAKGE